MLLVAINEGTAKPTFVLNVVLKG